MKSFLIFLDFWLLFDLRNCNVSISKSSWKRWDYNMFVSSISCDRKIRHLYYDRNFKIIMMMIILYDVIYYSYSNSQFSEIRITHDMFQTCYILCAAGSNVNLRECRYTKWNNSQETHVENALHWCYKFTRNGHSALKYRFTMRCTIRIYLTNCEIKISYNVLRFSDMVTLYLRDVTKFEILFYNNINVIDTSCFIIIDLIIVFYLLLLFFIILHYLKICITNT